MPARPSKTAPAVPSTLAEHEEAVRSRLVAHGQHGALETFGKYTAAVQAELEGQLARSVVAPQSPAQTEQIKSKAKKPAKAKASK